LIAAVSKLAHAGRLFDYGGRIVFLFEFHRKRARASHPRLSSAAALFSELGSKLSRLPGAPELRRHLNILPLSLTRKVVRFLFLSDLRQHARISRSKKGLVFANFRVAKIRAPSYRNFEGFMKQPNLWFWRRRHLLGQFPCVFPNSVFEFVGDLFYSARTTQTKGML
jgi:hypothetical protein